MSTTVDGSLVIIYQPASTLVSYPHNARTHSNHQIRQIARSITEFGFTNPILIDQNNTVVAGHGRLLAAQMLGMEQVPTIRLETLTQSQKWQDMVSASEGALWLCVPRRWPQLFTGVSKQSVYNNVLTDLFDLVGPKNYSYNRNTGQLKLYGTEWLHSTSFFIAVLASQSVRL